MYETTKDFILNVSNYRLYEYFTFTLFYEFCSCIWNTYVFIEIFHDIIIAIPCM